MRPPTLPPRHDTSNPGSYVPNEVAHSPSSSSTFDDATTKWVDKSTEDELNMTDEQFDVYVSQMIGLDIPRTEEIYSYQAVPLIEMIPTMIPGYAMTFAAHAIYRLRYEVRKVEEEAFLDDFVRGLAQRPVDAAHRLAGGDDVGAVNELLQSMMISNVDKAPSRAPMSKVKSMDAYGVGGDGLVSAPTSPSPAPTKRKQKRKRMDTSLH